MFRLHPQVDAPHVVLEHGVGKLDEFLRRAVYLAQQPALHGPHQGDGVKLHHQLVGGAVQLFRELVHRGPNDAGDALLKELPQVAVPDGLERTEAEGPVVLDVSEELQ